MLRTATVLLVATLGLAGCGKAPGGATETAGRLLKAAYDNDRVAFEAEIDRAAVRDDLRRQVNEMARATTLDVDGGPSEFALDRMISPDALRLVDGKGARLTAPPTTHQLAPLMKAVDANHACLRDAENPEHCVLTFAKAEKAGPDKAGKDWRLVGMRALDPRIEVAALGQ